MSRNQNDSMFAGTCLCLTRKQLLEHSEMQLKSKQSAASAGGGGGNLPVAKVNSTETPQDLQAWKGRAVSLASKR